MYLLVLTVVFPILVWNGAVQQFNASLEDLLLRMRGTVHAGAVDRIVLVAIDDATAARFGPLPLRRALLGQGLARLAALQPKAVALDVLLSEPGTAADDRSLAEVLAEIPGLVMSAALSADPGQRPTWILPLPQFSGRHLVGHVHAETDSDGSARSVLLAAPADGRRYWALALQAVRASLNAGPPLEFPDRLELGSQHIPAAGTSNRSVLINYAGPEGTFRRVSFATLLDGSARREDIEGKIVFVGATAQGTGDRLFTPFSSKIGMSGIEIHANVARTLLDRAFLLPISAEVQFGVLAILASVCAMGTARLRGQHLVLALASTFIVLVAGAGIALRFGHVWPVGTLLAGFVICAASAGVGEHAFVRAELRRSEQRQRDYAFRVQAIAHEIKTPLTAIQGSSEIITDQEIPDEQRSEIAGMIHRESKRLTEIIHTFLDVERMAAGSLALEKQNVDLALLCGEVLERARLYARRKHILIEADVRRIVVAADPDLLGFAVYNLLTNAVKYSPKRTTVTLTVAESRGEVVLSVVDQGFGIALEDQARLFDRFYRVKHTRPDNEEGTGIGLALVKEITVQHGGHVEVESREGAGSRFAIHLPGGHA